MRSTTSVITTGALSLGTLALIGTVAPGVASAGGCGVTTLDQTGLVGAFDGALTGVADGATAEMLAEGLHLTTPSAEDDPTAAAYAAYFMDGLEIPLSGATAQSNFVLDATLAAGQPLDNHPTYELYVDLDGPVTANLADAILVHWKPAEGEPSDLWWSALGPLSELDAESAEEATLVEISAAYPDATVTSVGFQLLYQPGADVVVHGMTFGCNDFRLSSGSTTGTQPGGSTGTQPGGDTGTQPGGSTGTQPGGDTGTQPGGGTGTQPGGDTGTDPDNQAPIAAVTATNVGATFTFSAAGSADTDGQVTRHTWDLGDGSAIAEGAQVVHAYTTAGTYTVTLTVTDDGGASTTATRQVVVPATEPTGPEGPVEYGIPLPDTGADVLGLAAIGGLVLAGGGAGLVASRRRRTDSAS